jgi:hypothetical protein
VTVAGVGLRGRFARTVLRDSAPPVGIDRRLNKRSTASIGEWHSWAKLATLINWVGIILEPRAGPSVRPDKEDSKNMTTYSDAICEGGAISSEHRIARVRPTI